MEEYDILIIGSTPATLIAANNAAINNTRILLISNKEDYPEEINCAEAIYSPNLSTLKLTLDDLSLEDSVYYAEIHSKADEKISVALSDFNIKAYIPYKETIIEDLSRKAEDKGVDIRLDTYFEDLKREDNQIIITVKKGDELETIKTKIIIADDGFNSRIREFGNFNIPFKNMLKASAAQAELSNTGFNDNESIRFYLTKHVPDGYAWIFPKYPDNVNVGIVTVSDISDKQAQNYLDSFINSIDLLNNAETIKTNIQKIPISDIVMGFAEDNIMLVGNAACQINPLTAGGLIMSLSGGIISGKIAAKAIESGDYSKNFLDEYNVLYQKMYGPTLEKFNILRDFILNLGDREMNKIIHNFSDLDFKNATKSELIKRFVKASPKAALRLRKFV